MEKYSFFLIVFSILLGVFIGYLLFYDSGNYQNKYIQKIDSVYIFKVPKEIKKDSIKGKIKYLKDTVILSKPFIAEMDSVFCKDTLRMRYTFPENYFSFELKRGLDSMLVQTITQENVSDEVTLFEKILILIFGFLIGIIVN